MNPTLDPAIVEAAFEADPASADAEYEANFRSDVAALLSRDRIEALVVPGRHELPPVAGSEYAFFADPAGGSGTDSFTWAGAHREDGRIVLDILREVRPPFSPDDVVKECADTLRAYGCAEIWGDRYAGAWPTERFAAHGIRYRPAEKSKSDLYGALLPLVNSHALELLDYPRLLAQLVGLERRVARGGRNSIDHAPRGHDDLANALAGVASLVGSDREVRIWGGEPVVVAQDVVKAQEEAAEWDRERAAASAAAIAEAVRRDGWWTPGASTGKYGR